MSAPILATKFFFPLPWRSLVPRPRLVEWLVDGLRGIAIYGIPRRESSKP
jgi:hypothetical protein